LHVTILKATFGGLQSEGHLRNFGTATTLLVLLLASFLFLPVSAASNDGVSPVTRHPGSLSTQSSNGLITQRGSSAGYEIFTSTPGTFLKIQATWNVPTVTCTSSSTFPTIYLDVAIGHIYAEDSGSTLLAGCNGLMPHYFLYYTGNDHSLVPLPPEDTVSAGDKVYTSATLAILGGETSIFIKDITKGWTFGVSGAEPIDTTKSGSALWLLSGGSSASNPLLQFSRVQTSGDKVTIGGHTGSLGSFVSRSGFTFEKWIIVDGGNGHALAKPSPLTASSTGFALNWIQGS
jgi:hypothetical protein